MRIIDLETHYAIKETYDLKGRVIKGYNSANKVLSGPGDALKTRLDLNNIDQRIAAMDEAGVDASVLSHQVGIEAADPEVSISLAKLANDNLYDITKKYTNRIYGWAVLPMRDPAAAAAELDRCINKLNFFGWNVYSNFGVNERLDDPMFTPVLEKANELGCVVYVHPTAPTIEDYQGLGPTLWGGLGYAADTMITVVRMLQTGVYDKYPKIKFVLGHFGEGFPFVVKRMSARAIDGNKKYSIEHYFKNNFWVTSSGNTEPAAFRCTYDVIGADHMLVGTDYPMDPMKDIVDFLNDMPMSVSEREKIYCGNAQKLVGDRLSVK